MGLNTNHKLTNNSYKDNDNIWHTTLGLWLIGWFRRLLNFKFIQAIVYHTRNNVQSYNCWYNFHSIFTVLISEEFIKLRILIFAKNFHLNLLK